MILTAEVPEMYNNGAPESHYEYVMTQSEEVSDTPPATEVSSQDVTDTNEQSICETTSAGENAPQEVTETATVSEVETEETTRDLSSELSAATEVSTPTDQDLMARANEFRAVFSDGFQWSDLAKIMKESYSFLKAYKDISPEDRRACVIKIIDYLIDITDTPFLPDRISDPVFKAMVPPFVDLMGFAIEGAIASLPSSEAVKPTGESLLAFAKTLKDSFSDGFQATDIATCVRASVEFLGTFPFLTLDEKRECVIQVIDDIIDVTDTPKLPDFVFDPIFKTMVRPIIESIFEKFGS